MAMWIAVLLAPSLQAGCGGGRTDAELGAASNRRAASRPAFAPVELTDAHLHAPTSVTWSTLQTSLQDCGARRFVLFGSPRAIFEPGADGFHDPGTNNRALLTLARQHPDSLWVFATVDVADPAAVDSLRAARAAGARGLKLYAGSTVYHTLPLDDQRLEPLFRYCDNESLPVVLHVHLGVYEDEFRALLRRYPRLRILCPHFCMSLARPDRLEALLAAHPNLYTDISLGYVKQMRAGFERISDHAPAMRRLILRFQDRVVFGTDAVLGRAPTEDPAGMARITRDYRMLLEADRFTSSIEPRRQLQGLQLPPAVLAKIYRTNFETFAGP